MTEQLHHHAGADPLNQQQRRAGVAQVMEPLPLNARLFQFAVERADDVGGVEGRAASRCEHQPPVLPVRPRQQTFLRLPRFVFAQGRDADGGEIEVAAAAVGLRLR